VWRPQRRRVHDFEQFAGNGRPRESASETVATARAHQRPNPATHRLMHKTLHSLGLAFALWTPATLEAQRQPMPLLRMAHVVDTMPQRPERVPQDDEAIRAHNGWRGAIYGAVLGGIGGGVLAASLVDHVGCNVSTSGSCDAGRRQRSLTVGSIGLGAAVGAGVGALVGLAWPTPDEGAKSHR